jgi:hypothetical protein
MSGAVGLEVQRYTWRERQACSDATLAQRGAHTRPSSTKGERQWLPGGAQLMVEPTGRGLDLTHRPSTRRQRLADR